jgi:hypothetical protein
MSNFKAYIFTICILTIGCKGPNFSFNSNKHVNTALWKDSSYFSALYKKSDSAYSIQEVKIYHALYEERVVIQNGVTNYQIANTASDIYNDKLLHIKGYSQQLFFMVFKFHSDIPMRAIFFSTSMNKNGDCIGIDPIYIGELFEIKQNGRIISVFRAGRTLKIKEINNQYVFQSKYNKDDVDILFELDQLVDNSNQFSVNRIVNGKGNMIASDGQKLVLYPNAIMNDTKALLFKLLKKIN